MTSEIQITSIVNDILVSIYFYINILIFVCILLFIIIILQYLILVLSFKND